ncbi:MAG: hypothetical protein ACKPKO_46890, partial [Candidatus Fonsibacter sp.]
DQPHGREDGPRLHSSNAVPLAASLNGAAGLHSRQGLCLYLGDGGKEDFDVFAGIQEGEDTA